jgi:hypothetical protein
LNFVAIVVTLVGVVLFIAIPHAHLFFLWGEMAVFMVMTLVGGSLSWLMSLLGVVMMLQVALQVRQHLRNRRRSRDDDAHVEKEAASLKSLGGFVKLLIFFMQTTLSVNETFWEAFEWVFDHVMIVNLNLSQLQCEKGFAWMFEVSLLLVVCYCLLTLSRRALLHTSC